MDEKVSTSGRLPALDGLRAISILLVLATHMLPVGPKFLRLNETTGAMGMSLFFILSGFLIATGLAENPNIYDFAVKRLSKILPIAYLYVFLVFTLIAYEPRALFWTASFLVNYVPEYLNSFNAHFWSLCVEVQFYAAIGLAVFCLGKRGVWIVWPACLLITFLRVKHAAYIDIATHLRVDEILAGSCLATVYHKRSIRPWVATTLFGGAALFWFVSSSPFSGWLQYLRPYAAMFLLGATLLLSDNTFIAGVLSSKPMRYVAAISYGLYVIHPLTVQGWWNEGSIFDRYLLKRPISFLMTFLAAHVATYYWERPWMRAARELLKSRHLKRLHASA